MKEEARWRKWKQNLVIWGRIWFTKQMSKEITEIENDENARRNNSDENRYYEDTRGEMMIVMITTKDAWEATLDVDDEHE